MIVPLWSYLLDSGCVIFDVVTGRGCSNKSSWHFPAVVIHGKWNEATFIKTFFRFLRGWEKNNLSISM